MKIAIPHQNGQVFQHFGKTKQFKLYTAEGGRITGSALFDGVGEGHGALAGILRDQGVDSLICGGIGAGARTALEEAGIAFYPGVTGNADAMAEALVAGTLQYDPDTQCADHHHHH